VRQYGMAKEGLIARQFMLGVVQTAEGLPIYHEVFDGNQAEAPTLLPVNGFHFPFKSGVGSLSIAFSG
jgi:transposase